jgi:hypothetical protein
MKNETFPCAQRLAPQATSSMANALALMQTPQCLLHFGVID